MSELTSHYRDRQNSLLQVQTAPCQLGALQCGGCPTHTAPLVLAGRGWIGWLQNSHPQHAAVSHKSGRGGHRHRLHFPSKNQHWDSRHPSPWPRKPRAATENLLHKVHNAMRMLTLPSKHHWPPLQTLCVSTRLGCGKYFRRAPFFHQLRGSEGGDA